MKLSTILAALVAVVAVAGLIGVTAQRVSGDEELRPVFGPVEHVHECVKVRYGESHTDHAHIPGYGRFPATHPDSYHRHGSDGEVYSERDGIPDEQSISLPHTHDLHRDTMHGHSFGTYDGCVSHVMGPHPKGETGEFHPVYAAEDQPRNVSLLRDGTYDPPGSRCKRGDVMQDDGYCLYVPAEEEQPEATPE